MPKRKYISRKPRRALKRRRMMITRRPRGLRTPTFTVKRVFFLQAWGPNTTSTTDFWRYHYVNLTQIPNYQEYTNMFDQYRLSAMKFTFTPNYTGYDGSNTTDTTLPGITNQAVPYITRCYDNRSTITQSGAYATATYNTFLEQGKVTRPKQLVRPISMYNKCTIMGGFVGGTAVNMWTRAKWLPTTAPAIDHYIGQSFITDSNFTGIFGCTMNVTVTAYLQFRNQK